MSTTPSRFVRVSLPHGHFTVNRVTAERGGWRILQQDAVDRDGRPLPPKPRVEVKDAPKPRKKRAPRLRDDNDAATPTTSEADAPDDSKE